MGALGGTVDLGASFLTIAVDGVLLPDWFFFASPNILKGKSHTPHMVKQTSRLGDLKY